MRLISFEHQGRRAIGALHGNQLVDLTAAGLPARLDDFVALGQDGLRVAQQAMAADPVLLDAAAVHWLAPLAAPAKAIAVGLNYVDHAAESNKATPTYPVLFHRFASSWVGPGEALVKPAASDHFDYEGELVVVIGKGGRHIDAAHALDHVYGYSNFNDGSVRDFQNKSSQWMMGKNFDRSGSFGPCLVTADELPPGARGLRLRTRLNGQTVQDASTNDMIFDVATLVSVCSVPFALSPGDIIISGTPSGVGAARKPQLFMRPGDRCEVEIEGIGTLGNPVVAEG